MLRMACFLAGIILIAQTAVSSAAVPVVFYSDIHPSVTGVISLLNRNTIEIIDEDDKRVKRFSYFFPDKTLKIGDRARVYFDPRTGLIDRLEKMTPVEYKKDGQNAGYILKSE